MRLRRPPSLLLFAAAAAFGAATAQASSTMPAPKMGAQVDELEKYKPTQEYTPPPQGRVQIRNEAGTEQSQTDAFQTAAEHAVYLQQYQRLWGPYGSKNPEREKLIADTAEAIQDCLKGQDCNDNKKDLIVKSLSQYNYGQEIKRMALVNRTNADRMNSIDDENLKQSEIWNSLNNGASVRRGRVSKVSGLAPYGGSSRAPYFQLDPGEVQRQMAATKDEIDKMGPEFINTYKNFIHQYSGERGVGDLAARRYKYVKAKYSDAQVYGEEDEHSPRAQQAMVTENEQNHSNIRDIVKEHVEKLTEPTAVEVKDGYKILGERGQTSGYYHRPTRAVVEIGPDGKPLPGAKPHLPTPQEYYDATNHAVNEDIKAAYEKDLKQQGGGDGSGASRMPAADDSVKRGINVSINAEEFDKFLEEIWPSEATRKQLIQAKEKMGKRNVPLVTD